jgi:simple sugar transport system substrate-binding protein
MENFSRRRVLQGLAALSGSALLASCTGSTGNKAASAAGSPANGRVSDLDKWIKSFRKKPFRVVTTCFATTNSYFVPMKYAALDVAAELGITSEWTGVPSGDTNAHIDQFHTLVRQGYDAIVVIPGDPNAWIGPINEAVKGGTMVLLANQDAPGSGRELFCGQDVLQGAVTQAKKIAELCSNKGKVALTNCYPGSQVLKDRVAGAHQGYKDTGMEIVGEYVTDPSDQAAEENTIQNILRAHPDLSAIQALCGPDTVGAGSVKQKTKGKFVVAGSDLLPQALQYVKNGVVQVTYGQNPYVQEIGPLFYAYQRIVMNMPKLDLPNGFMNSGTEEVTQANVDAFIQRESRWQAG